MRVLAVGGDLGRVLDVEFEADIFDDAVDDVVSRLDARLAGNVGEVVQERTQVDDVGSEVNDEPHPCEMRGCRNNEDEPIRPSTDPSYTAWWERPLRDGTKRRKPDFDAKKRWSRKRIPAPPINFDDPRRVNSRHCCGYNQ